MTYKFDFDVDIDMADRDAFLKTVRHVPASMVKADNRNRLKHATGVYFQKIFVKPDTGSSVIDFKAAEELGFFKVDFLNNGIYSNVHSMDQLQELIKQEPNWDLLLDPAVSQHLAHVGGYSASLAVMQPRSVEQLAMFIAVIRPAKKHLLNKSWNEIEKEIWEKPTDGAYYYKKSHSVAFAISITVQLNLFKQRLAEGRALIE